MMFEFQRTFDYALVRAIVTRPDIYPYLTSDGAPSAETFRVPEGDWNWYVLVRGGGEVDEPAGYQRGEDSILGLFWLVPYNAVCWEVHTCFLPALRGARAIRAYREGCEWLWRNSPCRKTIGNIPEYNRAALAVALRAGAHIIGINRKSLLKDGRLIDQTIVGKGIED